jgi:hypothetical protein
MLPRLKRVIILASKRLRVEVARHRKTNSPKMPQESKPSSQEPAEGRKRPTNQGSSGGQVSE